MNTFSKIVKIGRVVRYAMLVSMIVLAGASCVADEAPTTPTDTAAAVVDAAKPMVANEAQPYLFGAIAVIMACSCLGAAFAVGKIGAAVMGAAAEKPEVLGKAIAFVGLGEGIALFGFLVSLFMVLKIG